MAATRKGGGGACLENGLIGAVPKGDVLQLDAIAALGGREGLRIWRLGHLRLVLEQRKHGSHVHQRLLRLSVHGPQEVEGH